MSTLRGSLLVLFILAAANAHAKLVELTFELIPETKYDVFGGFDPDFSKPPEQMSLRFYAGGLVLGNTRSQPLEVWHWLDSRSYFDSPLNAAPSVPEFLLYGSSTNSSVVDYRYAAGEIRGDDYGAQMHFSWYRVPAEDGVSGSVTFASASAPRPIFGQTHVAYLKSLVGIPFAMFGVRVEPPWGAPCELGCFPYGVTEFDGVAYLRDVRITSLAPIPEPGTFMLMVLGLAGLALRRRGVLTVHNA